MTLRKFLKILLPFVVIGIPAYIAFDMVNSKPVKRQPEPSEKIWQVEVMPVLRQSLSPNIILYGRVESPEQLKAAASGAGIVESVNIRSGDIVSRGDVLVSLDRRDFRTQRILAEAELADLQSQISELKIRHNSNNISLKTEQELLVLAEQEVARMRQLKKSNLGSDTTLSEALNAQGRQQLSLQNRQFEVDSFPEKLKMLEARQKQAKARLSEAELKIKRGSIVAPFDAVISSVPVTVGDRVATGELLTSLYPLNSLEIRAHIANDYVDRIRAAISRGDSIKARLNKENNSIVFELLRLSGEAKATGIDAYFGNTDNQLNLRPGELLTLTLSLPAVDDAIAIPFQAIYGNSRIYLNRDNRLFGVDVETIGQIQDTNATNNEAKLLIHSDSIESNDKIVVTHLPNAVTGLKVRAAADKK
ncbi:MAG: HlyD family efflux transporter periplasmic adaptor subunit [Gammaproteobacteria bacterium]|nr:HlyD family efflux transporter periplasmic adaptor subunit [Gammaproteobacteria bacterium]